MNFMFSINWTTAYAIREEEFLGTLESIYVTPPKKAVLVLSHAVYALTYSGLSLLVQVVFVIYLMGGVPLVNVLLASGYIILAVFMVQGLSMILAAFVLTFKQGWRIVFTLQVAISLFTPAQFPLSTLPDWMYRIAVHSPFTTSTQGFRDAMLFGTRVSWLSDFAYMIFWGLALFYIGLRIYARQDQVLRSKGRLGKY
jgi:ABC-2 type transport system permease protein